MQMPEVKHVTIDREHMTFVGATMTSEGASILANLSEAADSSMVVMSLALKSGFSQFGRLELMLLIKNTTGVPVNPSLLHDFGSLVNQAYALALEVPVDQRSLFELQQEHAKLKPVFTEPKLPFKPAPVIHRLSASEVQNYVPPGNEPKAPRAPKVPSAPGAAPAKGSTGKVWTIADRVLGESGLTVGSKELRSKIIAACEAEGINAGTAATQYGKWKATK